MKAQVIELCHSKIFPFNTLKIALVILTLTLLTITPLYLSDYHSLLPYLSKKNPCLLSFVSRNLSLLSYPTNGINNEESSELIETTVVTITTVTKNKSNDNGELEVIQSKPNQSHPIATATSDNGLDWLIETRVIKNCDIFKGEWVPHQEGPYYTNGTCREIHDHQNCFKNGRPDTDFLRWRWKPYQCELPRFNPLHFLNIVRGKSMAFVGDSVARNQMQSLMCILSNVVYPVDVSYVQDGRFKRWLYTDYNFTIASFWSPHLVRTHEAKPRGPLVPPTTNLYLDEFDKSWTAQISNFDYIIISAGQWFWAPAIFYEIGQVVGCNACNDNNITDLNFLYGYRKAFNTAFKAFNSMESFKGMTFLRTYSPAHYDNGVWSNGGTCTMTRPFSTQEKMLDGLELRFHMTQVEELRAAEFEGRKRGLKFRALDTSQAMVLRPDGHPGRYSPSYKNNVVSDCVHWCLPGPIDVWNEMLLHMLKVDRLDGALDGKH